MAFEFLSINGPVVYNSQIQPKKLFLVDIKTGTSLRAYEPNVDLELNNHIITAHLLPPQLLSTLTLPVKPYGDMVQYLEHNNHRIVSLHTFLNSQLEQSIYVINNDGLIIYQDLLQNNIQKLQPEAFIVHINKLIYLKNRSELIIINL